MEDDIFKERAANEEAFAQRRRKSAKRDGAEVEDTRAVEAARRADFLDALQDAGCPLFVLLFVSYDLDT